MRRLRQQPQASSGKGARRKPRRGTPPNVIGKGPLLAAPGLHLGVVVIIRDEAPYLEEWLAYHRALGVQHFFIYDNGSQDELHAVIEPWVNHGLVTLVHWPLPGGQLDAYSHALRFYGPSVDWLGFFDVDEFVVPLRDRDIPGLLAHWPDAADVRIPRVDFGFSGHRTPPDGLTIEAYTEVADVFGRDPAKPPRVKTFLQPRAVSAVGIHTATVADAPISADGRPVPTETVARAVRGVAQLNHYYTRSFEEFEAKRVRGSATGRIVRPAIDLDLPATAVDTSATRFAERTRAVIEHMRSLAASPYRYGSELELAQFPRYNDLGLFGEFLVANTAAEEPELRREPRMRLPNLHTGSGFVGDIGELEHRPSPGELSGSIHLAALLQRTRGRLESSLGGSDDADDGDTVSREGLSETPEGWQADSSGEGCEIRFPLRSGGQRRCYALGFTLTSPAGAQLHVQLEHEDGSSSEPLVLRFERASTYAGIVELEPTPDLSVAAIARLSASGDPVLVNDLFVISYG